MKVAKRGWSIPDYSVTQSGGAPHRDSESFQATPQVRGTTGKRVLREWLVPSLSGGSMDSGSGPGVSQTAPAYSSNFLPYTVSVMSYLILKGYGFDHFPGTLFSPKGMFSLSLNFVWDLTLIPSCGSFLCEVPVTSRNGFSNIRAPLSVVFRSCLKIKGRAFGFPGWVLVLTLTWTFLFLPLFGPAPPNYGSEAAP